MFALVVLARRCLWVHHGHHWGSLAELSSEIIWTTTSVIVDAIDTSTSVLTHVVLAVINVLSAIRTPITSRTLASVVTEMVYALGAILAWIVSSRTEVDLLIAELARETRLALARVRLDSIHAGRVVLTSMVHTIIDVHFAADARVACQTLATETSLLKH